MRKKEYYHPKFYIGVKAKKIDYILVKYISNKFQDDGSRLIEKERIKSTGEFQANSFKEILMKLNKNELNNVNKYIALQCKVLHHHKKNNNLETIQIVNESIKLMKKFKEYYLSV